jgi:hypothetical protein
VCPCRNSGFDGCTGRAAITGAGAGAVAGGVAGAAVGATAGMTGVAAAGPERNTNSPKNDDEIHGVCWPWVS